MFISCESDARIFHLDDNLLGHNEVQMRLVDECVQMQLGDLCFRFGIDKLASKLYLNAQVA